MDLWETIRAIYIDIKANDPEFNGENEKKKVQ